MDQVKIKTTSVSSNFQTYIPAVVRKALNLKPGEFLAWELGKKNKINLSKTISKKMEFLDLFGKGYSSNLPESNTTYVKETRQDWSKKRLKLLSSKD